MKDHRDDAGEPCTQHVPDPEKLLALAALGSRASSLNHDAASKLQSLVMALDEISELIGEQDSEVRTATETAQSAVRQLHTLLTSNRALAKPPQRTRTLLTEMLQRAAERHAVKVRGDVPAIEVMVAPPSMTHMFAMLLDMIASTPKSGRAVEITSTIEAGRVQLVLAGTSEPSHPNANEQIAIAVFLVEREGGSLRCGPQRFVVELPLAE